MKLATSLSLKWLLRVLSPSLSSSRRQIPIVRGMAVLKNKMTIYLQRDHSKVGTKNCFELARHQFVLRSHLFLFFCSFWSCLRGYGSATRRPMRWRLILLKASLEPLSLALFQLHPEHFDKWRATKSGSQDTLHAPYRGCQGVGVPLLENNRNIIENSPLSCSVLTEGCLPTFRSISRRSLKLTESMAQTSPSMRDISPSCFHRLSLFVGELQNGPTTTIFYRFLRRPGCIPVLLWHVTAWTFAVDIE